MPSFFNEYGGSVISTTFDKFCYLSVRHLPPFMPYFSELVYSRFERVNSIDDIEHPTIREAMRMLDIHEIRLTYEADLPARTGLGTSSTFAVGMLNSFYALKGKYVGKRKLAEDAIYLERELCKESGGWQDQIAASYGGFNRIDFADNNFTVKPIIIHPDRKKLLNNSLLMFFTGISRFSSIIQKDTMSNQQDKISQLKEMLSLVDDAQNILQDKHSDMNDFGRLLHHTWELKRKTGGKITNSAIDTLYERGIKAGAPFVMLGHITVPELSGELPASLSPQIISILRNELNFEGVIITDSFRMHAITDLYDSKECLCGLFVISCS